jgi:hypothetical protein
VWPKFADTPVARFIVVAGADGGGGRVGRHRRLRDRPIIAETSVREEVEHGYRPLVGIFTPFFFALTRLDPQPYRSRLLAIVPVLTALAVLTAGRWRGWPFRMDAGTRSWSGWA